MTEKKAPLYLSRPKKPIVYDRCPVCGGRTIGLVPIFVGSAQFGCEDCHTRLLGTFFTHLRPISKTIECSFGHPIDPAQSLAPGEPADSQRVGWVRCPTCTEAIPAYTGLLAGKVSGARRIAPAVNETKTPAEHWRDDHPAEAELQPRLF